MTGCKITAQFRCDKEWDELTPLEGITDARHCDACQRKVYHCDTPELLQQHTQSGHCVACPAAWLNQEQELQAENTRGLFLGQTISSYIPQQLDKN